MAQKQIPVRYEPFSIGVAEAVAMAWVEEWAVPVFVAAAVAAAAVVARSPPCSTPAAAPPLPL